MVMSDKILNILFICDWNTARSVLAEVITNHEYHTHFKACSAGIEASDYVDPFVIGLIKDRYGINLINKEPRNFQAVDNINELDLIVTLSPYAFNAIKSIKKEKGFSTPIEFWETPPPPDKNQSRDMIMNAYEHIFEDISQHIENRFYTKF